MKDKLISRLFKYILGLFLVTVGVGFAIEADLGAAPVSAFPYTLQVIWGLDIGVGTMIFQSCLVVMQIFILRRNFKIKNLLQILVSIVFGWMTSFSVGLVGLIPDTAFIPLQILYVLAGSFFIALGIAFYVPSDIVPLPAEGLNKAISDVSGKSFSDIKIIIDCSIVIISGVLCLVFTGKLTSVGVGTVLLAVLVGLMNKQILKLFKKFGI